MPNLKYFLKSMFVCSMLFLFINPWVFSQKIPINRSHALSDNEFLSEQNLNATGTLNIVAIMVEFQPDDNRLTSGTGIFGPDGFSGLPYLTNETTIEPLPHNRAYFEAHLEFAKNYYEKASDGQLTLNYQVLPDIYRLPKKMEAYAPLGETFTNEKIAELARDAWQKVEEGSDFDATGLDPETTAFVIFHAGVGRDIELTGTSLDITPYDIPSLYLRKQNLKDLLNDPAFNGFSVNDGSFRVTNSLIIPRTESRRGLDIQDEEFTFPLSINGLLVASLGNHMGLPDLFNTETGEPGIGRFGLMDGAGFFAYNGLLPPEPSAWEKVYLGWETPFEITKDEANEIQLPAGSMNAPNSIARYSLSDSEYFLIENRHRDIDGTGITLTIQKPDGNLVQQTFTNEDEAFVFQLGGFDTLLTAGSIINASNFDFSLPGGLDVGEDPNDPSDDRSLNGGILIWHIDEAMITSQLPKDRVNSNPARRGVDLEEADGAQDIGSPVAGALDNSASFGSPYDFWWSGNDYRVILQNGQEQRFYENRFSNDTRPNNQSNSGAPSFFELYDFTENLPTASFKIRENQPYRDIFVSEISVQLDSSKQYYTTADPYYDYYPLSLSIHQAGSDTFLVVPSGEAVTLYDISDLSTPSFELTNRSIQQPFIGSELIIADKPASLNEQISISSYGWNAGTQSFDTTWTQSIPSNRGFISSQNGSVLHADFTVSGVSIADGSLVSLGNEAFQRSEIIGGSYSDATGSGVSFSSLNEISYLPDSDNNRLYTGTIQLGNRTIFYVFEDDRFSLIDPEREPIIETIYEEKSAEWPAILDDANLLRIDREANQLKGINKIGGTVPFTPVNAPSGVQFIGTPLYTDLISSGNEYAALVVGQDSLSMNIYAYHKDGSPVEGFPLYVGRVFNKEFQPIHPIIFNDRLFAISHDGRLKTWHLSQITDTRWASRYGEFPYNKVTARVNEPSAGQEIGYGVLNETETYNWPNPASDNTHIRFEVAPPGGSVQVTVISVSGRKIFEQSLETSGGFPQEIPINTSQWGNGGYIVRVKATVNGKTEIKLIKLGVVH